MKHDTELICFLWTKDSHWNISIKMNDSLRHMFHWSPVQSDAASLANNSQHCWMLHVASVCTPCCMLLRVVGSCCSKFETGQSFEQATPNISFVPWSPKRSATMLDPFATALPTLLEPRTRITHSQCKVLWVVSFPRCTARPYIDWSCCSHLHTILVPRARRFLATWSGSLQIKPSGSGDENVCTQLPTWTQQLPTLLV